MSLSDGSSPIVSTKSYFILVNRVELSLLMATLVNILNFLTGIKSLEGLRVIESSEAAIGGGL